MGGTFKFGFEEDDGEDHRPARRPALAPDITAVLSGSDVDNAVTVTVDESAAVLSVALSARWQASVDPRALGPAVVAAANAATARALAEQVELVARRPVTTAPAPTGTGPRITPEYVLGLMAAVSADLERFTRRLAEAADRPVTVESRGGHVRGAARRGQVLELAIDPGWARVARPTEVEREILEVLRALRDRGSPADLAAGPRSPAITELTALAGDPDTLLRRVGLLP
ncbi:hypothetical protein [Saccharothrix yanglingensis]|uniref:YbaB/EbfC DNA-binding family protein n=1 Tax=Saccharothrix yanglingensis TaxID=659496 RepID=A0ABU0X9P6_9PSEU|nr:hypothetical protein [Saccharothrix yanglingensis]MDQ2588681.1 hypothetical protein [Saccharothrix yanglingensis]